MQKAQVVPKAGFRQLIAKILRRELIHNFIAFDAGIKIGSGMFVELPVNIAAEIKDDPKRKRTFTEAQHSDLVRTANNILANLYRAYRCHPKMAVGLTLGKHNFERGGRYWDYSNRKASLSRTYLKEVLDVLASRGKIELSVATPGRNRHSSRIRASESLIRDFRAFEGSWADVRFDPSTPSVIVKDENKFVCEVAAADERARSDAQLTLERINAALENTLVNLDVSDRELATLWRHRLSRTEDEEDDEANLSDDDSGLLNFSDRHLRRIFALGRLNKGGRFYGGWWQGVPERLRKYIEIDGKLTVELDFSTMLPRMLYAKVGEAPPIDSYEVDGWNHVPRKTIKKAFNQLINSKPAMQKEDIWTNFAPSLDPKVEEKLGGSANKHALRKKLNAAFRKEYGRSYQELLADLISFHKPIRTHFFSRAWADSQYVDSQIAEMTMLRMLDLEFPTPILPIHDSFIVTRGTEKVLDRTMKQVFEEVIGVEATVDHDGRFLELPKDYDPKDNLVIGADLHQDTAHWMRTHKHYHCREAEWIAARGIID